jgi:hypothetical protein
MALEYRTVAIVSLCGDIDSLLTAKLRPAGA